MGSLERDLFSIKGSGFGMWARSTWQLRFGLQVYIFGGSLILFEFEDILEVERVLVRGPRRFRERLLSLERWQHDTGCLVKEGSYKEAWVRVLGLPLHLWSHEVFIKIGDCCGGFVAMDEGLVNSVQIQWARILVRLNGRSLPVSLQLVVGSMCYSIQLWWEVPPKFSKVVPRSCSEGSPESRLEVTTMVVHTRVWEWRKTFSRYRLVGETCQALEGRVVVLVKD